MSPVRAHVGDLRPIYAIMRRINTGADVQSVLEAIAEGVAQAVGFEVAAISYLTRDLELEVVTVAGSTDARDQLVGSRVPLAEMEQELALAEPLGSLLFIPAERFADVPTTGWIPAVDPSTDASHAGDRWRPEDTLRSPLLSPDGELLGLLSVDLPIDGQRPDAARRELLEMYAELAGVALNNAQRASDLEDQVRLSRAVEAINSTAAESLAVAHIVESSVAPVAEALDADTVWLRVFGDGGVADQGQSARHPAGGGRATPGMLEHAAGDARTAWADGVVVLARIGEDGSVGTAERAPVAGFGQHEFTGVRPRPTDAERVPVAGGTAGWVHRRDAPAQPATADQSQVVEFLRVASADNVLLAPLGAGPDCLGYLVAVRRRELADWSTSEVHAAGQIARNLGQAVLNARLLEHEQVLVAQLESLDHYKSDLISTVSHELRTPLTSISGHLELIEDDPRGATAASFEVVRRNLERVLSLIDDLLTLKRLTDSEAPVASGVVDLQQAAIDAASAVRPSAVEAGVTLVVVPSGGPLLISGDRDELERVALNLVGNAVKYSRRGDTVTVSTERTERFVRLVCHDTGIGISKADQEELFTEFFRSTNPDALTQPGTGLGLSIVRRIVQRHGGSIRLESDLGVGSTFTVRLPLSRVTS
ncbi:GAF domain-containing sensor histidine kinase [Nocardioides psychrotolerans]|uniref:GAF domain-containing sensor histidine kinase n=1 Tax=Nocardioides psychrotolerans TaxID=1005945 RepID=UPI0031381E4A